MAVRNLEIDPIEVMKREMQGEIYVMEQMTLQGISNDLEKRYLKLGGTVKASKGVSFPTGSEGRNVDGGIDPRWNKIVKLMSDENEERFTIDFGESSFSKNMWILIFKIWDFYLV